MARILAISSQVVRGHVGNSAAVPVLQALGHEVMTVPTVVLTSHPGHGAFTGFPVETEALEAIFEVLAGHGWLDGLDAVMTGYFRSDSQVCAVADLVDRLKAGPTPPFVLIDPILGDLPDGLYVPEEVAATLRDRLLPSSDCITPNRFELGWLSGMPVEDTETAIAAAGRLGVACVLATSVPAGSDRLANLLVRAGRVLSAEVHRRAYVPQGTGDLIAALLLGHRLRALEERDAFTRAVAGVDETLNASIGHDELNLAGILSRLCDVDGWPVSLVGGTAHP